MDDNVLDKLYKTSQFDVKAWTGEFPIGVITEKDKFSAAKQILLGMAILYVITIGAYLIRPACGAKLLDICLTTFPQLVTIILVAYFRDKAH